MLALYFAVMVAALRVLVACCLVSLTSTLTADDVDGKPFGYGDTIPIEEVEGFPSVKDFFTSKY